MIHIRKTTNVVTESSTTIIMIHA